MNPTYHAPHFYLLRQHFKYLRPRTTAAVDRILPGNICNSAYLSPPLPTQHGIELPGQIGYCPLS